MRKDEKIDEWICWSIREDRWVDLLKYKMTKGVTILLVNRVVRYVEFCDIRFLLVGMFLSRLKSYSNGQTNVLVFFFFSPNALRWPNWKKKSCDLRVWARAWLCFEWGRYGTLFASLNIPRILKQSLWMLRYCINKYLVIMNNLLENRPKDHKFV